jgi:hypothetical protein
MFSLTQGVTLAALVALAHGQVQLISAQGTKGSNASIGLQSEYLVIPSYMSHRMPI